MMERYEKYKDSGVEWIGEIPDGGEVKKLKYIADANPSNIDKKSKDNEEAVLLCNYVDVYKNEFISSELAFMKATAKFDDHLLSSHTDIAEVLDYLTRLFTSLCHSIADYGTQNFKSVLGDFQFLFGGWSWKDNEFKLWRLEYNHEAKAFMHDATNSDEMFHTFIGDELEKSQKLLVDEISKSGKTLSRRFDMEPFKVLIDMIRNESCSHIAGAVQIAKIHPPGATEFLGVYWPSIKYAFEEMFIDKLIERMDQNQEIFEKILENQSFGNLVKELMMKKVYARLNEVG